MAYELRISDWSSDVCSSVLFSSLRRSLSGQSQGQGFFLQGSILDDGFCPVDVSRVAARYRTEPACADQAAVSHGPALQDGLAQHLGQRQRHAPLANLRRLCTAFDCDGAYSVCARRSEEHTSELQSLMRTSYAVFCFTNKTTQ